MTNSLNEQAQIMVDSLLRQADQLKIHVSQSAEGASIIDCGVDAPGGLEAGRQLAEICLAGLGKVSLISNGDSSLAMTSVHVESDQPLAACMASQYAGWQIVTDDFFAMGSGPMRAAAAREDLFKQIGFSETPSSVVGILETSSFPTLSACQLIAEACSLPVKQLTLLIASTASYAGSVQIVARALETALHKMHELGFDLQRIQRGTGRAPLCPIARDHLAAIGVTNDAVLYGGEVEIWVTGDDASLREIGAKIPSNASSDYGRPFMEIFEQYNHDFYSVDPHLFSPALIHITNVETGSKFEFGELNECVLKDSFHAVESTSGK